jgi:hypothetical protein
MRAVTKYFALTLLVLMAFMVLGVIFGGFLR